MHSKPWPHHRGQRASPREFSDSSISHGIAWWMGQSGGPLEQAFAQQAPAFASIAWAVLALCWGAALASWLARRKSHHLVDTRTGLDSLAALGLFPSPPWISPHFSVDKQYHAVLAGYHAQPVSVDDCDPSCNELIALLIFASTLFFDRLNIDPIHPTFGVY